VPEALAQLGELDGPEAVARFFYSGGVRGVSSFNNCPVQKWLKSATGIDTLVGHVFDHIGLVAVHTTDGNREVVPLPTPVRQFVKRFDYRCYPQLELPSMAAKAVGNGFYCQNLRDKYFIEDLSESKELVSA
jgi:hypothetical protein